MNRLTALILPVLCAVVPLPAQVEDSPSAGLGWVSFDSLLTSDGPSWRLLGDDGASVQQALEIAAHYPVSRSGDCGLYLESTYEWESEPPNRTLDDLVLHAQAIFEGRVLALEQGFLHGEIGSLVRVQVQVAHLIPDPPREVLVYYPEARLELGESVLCARNHRPGEAPQIGQRVVVFDYRSRVAVSPDAIIYPADEEWFFELADGLVSVPAHARRDVRLTVDEFEARLAEAIRSQP